MFLLTGHFSDLVITGFSLSLSCSCRLQLYIICPTGSDNRNYEPHDLNEKRKHWKLKEEALDRVLRRTGFRTCHGLAVRQSKECMNIADFKQNVYQFINQVNIKINITKRSSKS